MKQEIRQLTKLTLKVQMTTAADDNFDFFLDFLKIRSLHISCESSAWQTIHMKYQDLFSMKNKKNNFRMSSAINFAQHIKG